MYVSIFLKFTCIFLSLKNVKQKRSGINVKLIKVTKKSLINLIKSQLSP